MRMKARIKELIAEGRHFLITTHIDPDGDAIGSVFAFAFALESLGKKATVYLKDQVPYRYEFLPGPRVHHAIPHDTFDAVFVLDCGSLFRIGNGDENVAKAKDIVNIDHHDTNDHFGTINYVDKAASSAGEIIYGLLKYLNVTVDKNIAVNIYTAVFTDTGSLRYDNTSLNAYRVCEDMIRAGASPSRIATMVYENHPKERYLLLGEVLRTLATYDDRIAMVHVTGDMFEKTGTSSEFVDGFVEFIKEIRGIEVAVLMRELRQGLYKISMRGKGTVDVAAVCNMFGGGGHKNAAGCRIEGNMEEARERLLEALHAPGSR
jgi:phosphoesterase RecJ-like protein